MCRPNLCAAFAFALVMMVMARSGLPAEPAVEYATGVLLFQQGEYETALEHFERAVVARPVPEILYNIALVHMKLDNPFAARTYLRAYIRVLRWRGLSGGARLPDPVDRPEIQQLSKRIMTVLDDYFAHWPKDRQRSTYLDSYCPPGTDPSRWGGK